MFHTRDRRQKTDRGSHVRDNLELVSGTLCAPSIQLLKFSITPCQRDTHDQSSNKKIGTLFESIFSIASIDDFQGYQVSPHGSLKTVVGKKLCLLDVYNHK